MPDTHARFSPSAADRYIHCPPSLILGEEAGAEDTSSDYSREGTEAHSLGEFLLKEALGIPCEDPRPGLHYYTDEMQECAEGYRDAVLEIFHTLQRDCPDAIISIEQRVSIEEYADGAFGTSDAVLIGNGEMFIVDYKHGRGVEVSAEDNAQLKCYALGAYLAFSPLYDIQKITLVIYQPRINNFSQWSLTTEALLNWAENDLRPAAEMALHGEGDFACGPWCRFCRAKAVCRKRAEENMMLARYDFARPDSLEDDEINIILGKVDALTAWANDVREYALQRALAGYAWDDWKVVEGRSVRKYADEDKVAAAVKAAGYDPYERKLLNLTEMQKMLGKKQFEELLGPLVIKPEGKPTLVSRSDKREEINTAMTDFKEEN
ncbi:MAG TPA: DUF2800 domain-containing protein [Clostridia bacterium]|nr:DUF2800 domain-containing protein [Clostridia bacterium]